MPKAQDNFSPEQKECPSFILWKKWTHKKTPQARDALFDYYHPWCRKITKQLYRRYQHDLVDWEDYLHSASVALLKCIERYKPNHGVPFEPYCYSRIKGSIIDYLSPFFRDLQSRPDEIRRSNNLHHNDLDDIHSEAFSHIVNDAIDIAFGHFLELGITSKVEVEHTPQVLYENYAIENTIIGLIENLRQEERFIINSYYFHHLQFNEIAAQMKVSRARVSQIHKAGIKNLTRLFEKKHA